MLQSGMQEAQHREIALPGVEKSALLAALEWMYAGETRAINADNCIAVLHLAHQFLLHDLACECGNVMQGLITDENWHEILSNIGLFMTHPAEKSPVAAAFRSGSLSCAMT